MSKPSPHEFVRWLVGSLVDQPDDLVLYQSRDGRHDLIEVRVAAADLPVIIGRGGRTAQSLRAVLDAWTWKHHLRAHLRILEEDEEPQGTLVAEGDDASDEDDQDDGASAEAADE